MVIEINIEKYIILCNPGHVLLVWKKDEEDNVLSILGHPMSYTISNKEYEDILFQLVTDYK